MTAVQRLDARIRGLGEAIQEVGGRLAEDEETHYMTPSERHLNEAELDQLVKMRNKFCIVRRRVIESRRGALQQEMGQ